MKSLRLFAIILFLSGGLAAAGAGQAFAQTETVRPQVARNITEFRNGAKTDNAVGVSTTGEAGVSTVAVPPAVRIGVQTGQTMPLTLDEAIRKALENNNNIEIAKNDVRIAESSLRSLLGIYDPIVTLNPKYTNNVQPQPSTLGGADLSGVTRSNEFRFDSNYRQSIKPGGGDVTVFFNNSRNETSSRFSQLNPTFNTGLGVTYNQPLFRDRAIDGTRRQIRIQRKRVGQSDADFRRTTIEIIAQVQRTYWELVFALRDQQNRLNNLNLTKENLRQIEARIAAGAAAPLQRAEVATELANREGDVLLATQLVSVAENALKQLILRETSAVEWTTQLVPTDRPVFSDDPINLDTAIKEAVDNRYELRRLKIQKEINTIDIDYFKNQLRPQVDLNATYNLIGLSGTSLATAGQIPEQFVGGYGQSLSNLVKNDTRSIVVGLTISFPIRNQTAKADLATAQYQKTQIEAQTRAQEQTILAEVRNAVQAAETSRQRVLTARRSRENAEIQLEGERKLFEVGRSTQFLLFQRENALTNARNSEIRAETDYNKALSELQRVTSSTFRVNNIEVQDPQDEK